MELFTIGFPAAFGVEPLLYCLLGVTLGTLIGVLPGIGPLATISILLPVTFGLPPAYALIMLAGVYYGSQYGGSTTAILINLPGEASSVVTAIDGYQMAKQGRAGVALFMATMSSLVGSAVGIIALMVLSPLLAKVVLTFGAGEFFAVLVLGLIAAASISSAGALKGIAMVMVGLLLGCVGMESNTGVARFYFGQYQLYEGIDVVILAMGLFGITEIIHSVGTPATKAFTDKIALRSMVPSWSDIRQSTWPSLRGSGIGAFFGVLPGTGPMLASFFSYMVEKRVTKTPERFGHGAIEGVVGPEAANNAAVPTAFIPMLTMGIPGNATMAVMLGAMMMHGITPGPLLMQDHPELFWGLVASFWIGNIMLLVLNIPLIGIWVRLITVPYHLLYPIIVVLICIGVYVIHNSVFDLGLVIAISALGYLLRPLGFEPAPLILGFILGPMMEVNLRRALLLSNGDYMALFQRPVSGIILSAAILIILWKASAAFGLVRRKRPAA